MRSALVTMAFAGAACAYTPLHVYPAKLPRASPRAALAVGVGFEDITPPPGFPTGGHGLGGGFARGAWGRLRARAFVFVDRNGSAVALVSCDLFAVPGGLRDEVARLVAMQTRAQGIALPQGSIVLAATHTHQSPGNYMTSTIYNSFGSRQAGFSPDLFAFLAGRIATAVVRAVDDAARQPGAARLSVHVGTAGGSALLRNRSPDVFDLNRDARSLIAQWDKDVEDAGPSGAPEDLIRSCRRATGAGQQDAGGECTPREGEPPGGWDSEKCTRLHALDRAVTVVVVERTGRAGRELVGALVFLAVHPTVLRHDAPLYSADFTGIAMSLLEQDEEFAARARPGVPVFAFFNGAEGDVTARRGHRDAMEVIRFGEELAKVVKKAAGAETALFSIEGTDEDALVSVRSKQVRWQRAEERRCRLGDGAFAEIAAEPMFGVAAAGGGEDDRTILYNLGWREGVVGVPQLRFHKGGQGLKTPAMYSDLLSSLPILSRIDLTHLLAPPGVFPLALPLEVVDIGRKKNQRLRLAAVPFEMSGATGDLVRRELRALGDDTRHGHLELIGLANECAGYVASFDEYDAQDYMGASTLWGPNEAAFVACELNGLAGRPAPPPEREIPEAEYLPGRVTSTLGPGFFSDTIARPDQGLGEILRDPRCVPTRRLPWFGWHETVTLDLSRQWICSREDPVDEAIDRTGADPEWTAFSRRRVEVWREDDDGWKKIDDDRQPWIATVLLGARDREPECGSVVRDRWWGAIWLKPLVSGFSESIKRVSFVVEDSRSRRCTGAFTLDRDLPALCLAQGPCPGDPGAQVRLADGDRCPGDAPGQCPARFSDCPDPQGLRGRCLTDANSGP